MGRRFRPRDAVLPTGLEHERFRLRPITIHDVVKDYSAVMTHREHLWSLFGEAAARAWVESEWPFKRVAYPGREQPWNEYLALPDAE